MKEVPEDFNVARKAGETLNMKDLLVAEEVDVDNQMWSEGYYIKHLRHLFIAVLKRK